MSILASAAFSVGAPARAQTPPACNLTEPQVLATGLRGPARLAASGGFVYFFEFRLGPARVSKNGGAPDFDWAGNFLGGHAEDVAPDAYGIATTAKHVYISAPGLVDKERNDDGGAVMVYDQDGNFQTSFFVQADAPGDCRLALTDGIAATADDNAYWLQPGVTSRAIVEETGYSCPPDPVESIGRLSPGATTPVLGYKAFGQAGLLRAGATEIVFADQVGIWRLNPLDPGIHAPRIAYGYRQGETLSQIVDVAIDENAFYFSEAVGAPAPGVTRVDRDSTATTISDLPMTGMHSRDGFLYGTVFKSAGTTEALYTLYRTKPNGHGLTFLARTGEPDIALDDTYVYYIAPTGDSLNQTLMKACR